jgi:hypothetical protein
VPPFYDERDFALRVAFQGGAQRFFVGAAQSTKRRAPNARGSHANYER